MESINLNKINKIYILNIQIFDDKKIFDYWYDKMPLYRKEKINKCYRDKDKKLSLGAGILLNNGLEKLGIVNKELFYNKDGKPYLNNKKIFFNIAHSNNLVACVFSSKEVGVDIEKIKKYNNLLINKICVENEINYIKNSDENNDLLYTKLWTVKESFMKYLGIGITLNPKNIVIDLEKNNCIKCDELNNKKIYLTTIKIDDFLLTICSENNIKNEIEWFKYNN